MISKTTKLRRSHRYTIIKINQFINLKIVAIKILRNEMNDTNATDTRFKIFSNKTRRNTQNLNSGVRCNKDVEN